MAPRTSRFLAILLAAALAACGDASDGAFDVVFIDREENLFEQGVRLSDSGQHVRAAMRSGLVSLDRQGEVVPALADRWNVIDSGGIFVFRLREGSWPDGTDLTAESVRVALEGALRDLRGTSLGLDLAPITEVRAMAGRVVEIRLEGALPDLLQLLAQPELALASGNGDTGPMAIASDEDGVALAMKPPQERGLPVEEDWQRFVRPIYLHATSARRAIEAFEDGGAEVVLGGRISALPLADTGPLSRGTVRLDPAIGLFGLHVRRAQGVLEAPELREALSMALDRPALMAEFNIGGWTPTTRPVPPGLFGDAGLVAERWPDESLEDLRGRARTRIAAWRSRQEDRETAPTVSLLIDDEPGHEILFRQLASQWAAIGVNVVRAQNRAGADLILVDRVARYAAPRWFLNQFNCSLDRGLCDETADELAEQSLDEVNPVLRTQLLADAEIALTRANVYIPLGSPIRWSLVRGTVGGFVANPWAFHPLPALAELPR